MGHTEHFSDSTVDTMGLMRSGYFALAIAILLLHCIPAYEAAATPGNGVVEGDDVSLTEVNILARNESAIKHASGCTPEYGTHYHFPGGEGRLKWGYKWYIPYPDGWTSCARLCANDQDCTHWMINHSDRHCFLQNQMHSSMERTWYTISGNYDCYISAEC